MLKKIAPADVHDERHAGRRGDDVREVLIRGDAQIDTAWLDAAFEGRNDVLERVLVRNEVLRAEVPAWLGQLTGQAPEVLIAQTLGQRDVGQRSPRRHERETAGKDEE